MFQLHIYRISNPTMEEISTTNPKYCTSHYEFNGTRSCTFTRQIAPSLHQQSSRFPHTPYKCPPSINKIFFVSLFHFDYTLFCRLVGVCMNPGNSFVCLITHSFLNGFQPNSYQHFFHVAVLYQS